MSLFFAFPLATFLALGSISTPNASQPAATKSAAAAKTPKLRCRKAHRSKTVRHDKGRKKGRFADGRRDGSSRFNPKNR